MDNQMNYNDARKKAIETLNDAIYVSYYSRDRDRALWTEYQYSDGGSIRMRTKNKTNHIAELAQALYLSN